MVGQVNGRTGKRNHVYLSFGTRKLFRDNK